MFTREPQYKHQDTFIIFFFLKINRHRLDPSFFTFGYNA